MRSARGPRRPRRAPPRSSPSSARSAARGARTPRLAASAWASLRVPARGVRRGHRHAGDAVGAERVDGHQRDERRVDPAAEPEHDVLEAVLARVVARAEHERARRPPRRRRPRRPTAARSPRQRPAPRRPVRRRRAEPVDAASGMRRRFAPARIAQPGRADRTGSTSEISRSSSNCGARARRCRRDRPPASGRRRRARPARRRARRTRSRRACRAHAAGSSARADALARVVGRGRQVDDQARARQRLAPTAAGRAARCPRRSSGRR